MNRKTHAITLLQATQDSPTLARLTALAQDSSARLRAIEPLIPIGLQRSVRPGPINDGVWCIILDNNAVAAKMRQLLPALESHLRAKGWEVTSIRLKVQT